MEVLTLVYLLLLIGKYIYGIIFIEFLQMFSLTDIHVNCKLYCLIHYFFYSFRGFESFTKLDQQTKNKVKSIKNWEFDSINLMLITG